MTTCDAIAVFVRFAPGEPAAPSSSPLGRAALQLGAEGARIVFCQPETPIESAQGRLTVTGQVASGDRWQDVAGQPIAGAYLRVSALAELRRLQPLAATLQRAGVPLCNPLSLVSLCRDKLRWDQAARRAKLPFPESVVGVDEMTRALEQWRGGFLKPRLGACGRDVVRIRLSRDVVRVDQAGPPLELSRAELMPWLVARQAREPQLLQREVVVAPGPWQGLSIRSLAQRRPSGRWITTTPVVRWCRDGVAGNFSQGAQVMALAHFPHLIGGCSGADLCQSVTQLDQQVTEAVDAELGPAAPMAVELGIDYVPDEQGGLQGIEVNDTPQGRLAIAAAGTAPELQAAHHAALRRPLDYLIDAPPRLAEACQALRSAPTSPLP
jgi:hypothetical protein